MLKTSCKRATLCYIGVADCCQSAKQHPSAHAWIMWIKLYSWRRMSTVMAVIFILGMVVLSHVSKTVRACECKFTVAPGVVVIHCRTNCGAGYSQCCSCGIISSQCRCCPPTTTCWTLPAASSVGVGFAQCPNPG